jgi:DNA mismatch endonuclease (patch repair protein)
MRKIKGSNALPERLLWSVLDTIHVDYRKNVKELPGTPDIVLDKAKVAVFVHGCFWHGCPVHYRPPKTRAAFWAGKVARTMKRDAAARRSLICLGWKVVEIWEHEVRKNPKAAARRVARLASQSRGRDNPKRPLSSLRRL